MSSFPQLHDELSQDIQPLIVVFVLEHHLCLFSAGFPSFAAFPESVVETSKASLASGIPFLPTS